MFLISKRKKLCSRKSKVGLFTNPVTYVSGGRSRSASFSATKWMGVLLTAFSATYVRPSLLSATSKSPKRKSGH